MYPLGFVLPVIALGKERAAALGLPEVGIGLGTCCLLPIAWGAIATLPFGGVQRFREFLRYVEIHERLSIPGLAMVHGAFIALGLWSVAVVVWR